MISPSATALSNTFFAASLIANVKSTPFNSASLTKSRIPFHKLGGINDDTALFLVSNLAPSIISLITSLISSLLFGARLGFSLTNCFCTSAA